MLRYDWLVRMWLQQTEASPHSLFTYYCRMWLTWDADDAICFPILLKGKCGADMDWRILGFRARGDFTVIDRDVRVCLPDMELLRSLDKGGGASSNKTNQK